MWLVQGKISKMLDSRAGAVRVFFLVPDLVGGCLTVLVDPLVFRDQMQKVLPKVRQMPEAGGS